MSDTVTIDCDNNLENMQNNTMHKQQKLKKKLQLGWIIFLFTMVVCYIYLIIPVNLYWNVMGVEVSMYMHYQPLNSCLYGRITTSIYGGKICQDVV